MTAPAPAAPTFRNVRRSTVPILSSPSKTGRLLLARDDITPSSAHCSARRDGPRDFDRAAAHAVDLVDHVAHDTAVVRHDADHVTDLRALAARREVDDAVLFREPGDDGVRILHEVAVALHRVLVGR